MGISANNTSLIFGTVENYFDMIIAAVLNNQKKKSFNLLSTLDETKVNKLIKYCANNYNRTDSMLLQLSIFEYKTLNK